MSKQIREQRKEKMKNDLARALTLTMAIGLIMIILFGVITLMPHKKESMETITFSLWEYNRNTIMFLLTGVGMTVFLVLFGYWFYEDQKLFKEQNRALIREMIQEENARIEKDDKLE